MDNTRGDNPSSIPRPSVLALSRQKMPNLEGTSIEGVCKGGYTVYGGEGKPDAIIMGTGAPAACSLVWQPSVCPHCLEPALRGVTGSVLASLGFGRMSGHVTSLKGGQSSSLPSMHR